ncbi:DUF6998 domain-containing protein [Agromyces sp. NPDC057679]|uniref:DUF6998 domain-containing protein n=1 Tax=Agromyces sp. NPDC057679 TaxID=3346207 RepID=UPI003671D4F1
MNDLTRLTVRELLALYSGIIAELTRRSFVRTKNPPIGDLAEFTAAIAYSGVLEKNSAKAFDLVAEDGRRIQVKARAKDSATKPGQVFSPIRSTATEMDACVFVIVNSDTRRVLIAREWTAAEVHEHGKHRTRTNAIIVRLGQIRPGGPGVDVTAKVEAAWEKLMDAVDVVS